MGIWQSYRMRLRRKRAKIRAFRKHFSLRLVADRTAQIRPGDVLLFSTLRDEYVRLPYFLQYYRDLGIGHFLIVDNDSGDGGTDYLARQPDVSLWTTGASYKRARFGVDWLNWLQGRYGHGHWTLVVDPDEFLIYPFCDTRPIRALTDWLDTSHVKSFGAMLLDMYPKGRIDAQPYRAGQNPLEIASWFDAGNYRGVHLTSQVAKVVERLLGIHLAKFFGNTGVCGPNQFAYRKKFGYKDALALNTLMWVWNLANGRKTVCLLGGC